MKRVGLGLIGAGAFGEFCLSAFAEMPNVRISGIADADHSRAEAMADRFGARAHLDLDSLLDDPDVQVVALNTPPFLHAEQGFRTLAAGKHLFCEKPLALDVDGARRLIQTADEMKLALSVNYVMRHNPCWKAAAALRESGVLGALRHLDLANHAAGLSLPPTHWFWDTAKSGGIWIEHGVHFFDAFAWVSGQQGVVRAATERRRSDGAIDRVEALVDYGDAGAHFYHAFDQSAATEHTTVRLSFERGFVTLHEWVPTTLELTTPVPSDEWQHLLPGEVNVSPAGSGLVRAIARLETPKTSTYRSAIQAGLCELINHIDSAGRQSWTAVAEAALASLRTAVDATASAGTQATC